MTAMPYIRSELTRTARNVRFFVFSLLFPLVMYLLIAGPNRHATVDGIHMTVYLMAGMIAWGAMAAVIAGGARIAMERAAGWHRQLRITPLTTRAYFTAKVLSGYLVALATIAVLAIAATGLGVRVTAARWVEMIGLILVGLVPFAAIGVIFGHLLSVDSMGAALGGVTSLFALLGGSWGPLFTSGPLRRTAELLPSYWLVQAGQVAAGRGGWPIGAWIVVVVWSAVMIHLAVLVYRRDTARA